MRITYFDLETTGLDKQRNDVIQIAYAIFDDNVCVRSDVMHFFYENMSKSSPEALSKHNMSYEYLKQFAGDFKRNLYRTFSVLDKAVVAGFNNNNFDNPFITYWLQRQGSPELQFKDSIDVMCLAAPIVHKQRISLIKLCAHFNITTDIINAKCKEWFGVEGKAHNAYYDVAATRLCHEEELKIYEEEDKGKLTSSDLMFANSLGV